ncbi:Zn-dependent hydrolase [Paenibacillus donghaensis]|uniref:Allantoate amidohydrolase n=1 Tax=Paenibacillus donghaensis TaxID=414771 RepID=A0A2Z2K8Q5_9BACL|nr:Zn-dependent hydrolase [Paenibacillus donghaensis]ASA19695.1 allantoate amidohydrolase [Paenibacillus donghaensis]
MSGPLLQAPALEMLKLLEELAAFSAPGPGVTRLLYTPEWSGAQSFLRKRMAALDLATGTDEVGNLYGSLRGRDPQAKVILTGSHIDTVVNGGAYDGAYGIAAALTAVDYLRRTFGQPRRTLEVVSFCEEEGSRFPLAYWGSGHVTGVYGPGSGADRSDADGVELLAAMKSCGYGPGSVDPSTGSPRSCALRGDIGAFVELHIEQGIVLEQSGQQIGVVQAIAGQLRFTVKVGGTANHAGTTPMALRRDAVAGAAEMLLTLEQTAAAAGDPLVATAGRLEVYPNTPNVIPGRVLFTLDLRHSEAAALETYCAAVLLEFEAIAARRGLELHITPTLQAAPAPMDSGLRSLLENICRSQRRTYRSMVSGAGHDAQLFSPRCRAAMIFVPSQAGISHSPDEYSSPQELAAGLDVLTAMLYELAYREE